MSRGSGVELHLHLGAHRTATTAVQRLLDGKSALLEREGVTFLGPRSLRGWGLYDVLQGMTDGRPMPGLAHEARRALSELARPARRVVLSDENLIGDMMRNHAEASLYADAPARLAALSRVLPAMPEQVVFTIRDPGVYWQSVFAHLASRDRLQAFEAERLSGSSHNSWLPVLAAIRAAFPASRLRVLGYDDSVTTRLAGALVGLALAGQLPPARRSCGLALGREAAASLDNVPAGPEREAMALRLRSGRDGPDRVFSAPQAAALAAGYAADWAALRAGVLPGAILDEIYPGGETGPEAVLPGQSPCGPA